MIEEKIYQDYVAAMKAKDKARSDFLNFIRADIKNQAIAVKKDKLDDNEVLTVLGKQKKKLEDAKLTIGTADKPDFIKEVDFQIGILKGYLPQALSDEELSAIVSQAVTETGASSMKDMGKVMKEVMAKVGVRAEAKKINEIVRSKLGAS